MAAATVAIEDFTFTKGKPAAYESSPGLVRLFCGKCGTPLGMQAAENPTLADFSLGQLDDPNAIKPEFHITYGECGQLVPNGGRPATAQ